MSLIYKRESLSAGELWLFLFEILRTDDSDLEIGLVHRRVWFGTEKGCYYTPDRVRLLSVSDVHEVISLPSAF